MRLRAPYLLFSLLAVIAAACGSDDSATSTAASNVAPSSESTAASDVASTAAPQLSRQPAVSIGVRDYAFDRVPRTITAGSPIEITNTSTGEAHELTAFRLPAGETRPLSELRALPPEEFGKLIPGAPVLALVARPGADGDVVLGDGSLNEPGRYLFVCFIPIGAKPDDVLAAMTKAAADPNAGPPQIEGGPPHMTAGMIAEVQVVP